MRERNTLRYSSLNDVLNILNERPPADMDEVRAVLMNLIEIAEAMQRELLRLRGVAALTQTDEGG